MKVTLDVANCPPNNTQILEVSGVRFSNRTAVEKFIKHLRAELDQLWPKEKKK